MDMPEPKLEAAIVPVTPLQQNCTLLWDAATRAAVVIDPGGDVPSILEAVRELGLQVERVWLTHGHFDHAGGAAELAEALGVEVWGPDARDAFLLDGLAETGAQYRIAGARPVRPSQWLTAGDSVTVGPHAFEVRHCPGHTPGHVVFVGGGLAVVGDVLFRGSVGRTDFAYGDPEALLRSIRERLMDLPDGTAFVCGHGPGSTIGAERRSNPYVAEALRGR